MVQCEKICDAISTKSIGETVQNVLSMAKHAQRITLGFLDAIKLLSKTPEEAQFCFLAEPKRGDSATHMHEVLLQAFCYEHGIYIIKVDDGRKLAHSLGTLNSDETCVLILKHRNCLDADDHDDNNDNDSENDFIDAATQQNPFNSTIEEELLINFCESSYHNTDYYIVKLPESWKTFQNIGKQLGHL